MKIFERVPDFKKNAFLYLIIIWIITITTSFYLYGFVTGLEAEKYIREAQRLIQHKGLSASRFIFYLPTVVFIYLSLKMYAGFYVAFLLQALYNLFVTLFFFKTIRNYFILLLHRHCSCFSCHTAAGQLIFLPNLFFIVVSFY